MTQLAALQVLILISVAVDAHQVHTAYSARANTPPMSTGCIGQIDALLKSVKKAGASQQNLLRIARFFLQEVCD